MENLGIGAGLGTMGFWISVGLIIGAGIWDNARKREAQHETIRRIIESGQTIDDALLDKLMNNNKDLIRELWTSGIIMIFIALGMAILGWLVSFQKPQALFPLLGVSALIGCISLGLLLTSRLLRKSSSKSALSSKTGRVE